MVRSHQSKPECSSFLRQMIPSPKQNKTKSQCTKTERKQEDGKKSRERGLLENKRDQEMYQPNNMYGPCLDLDSNTQCKRIFWRQLGKLKYELGIRKYYGIIVGRCFFLTETMAW